MYIHPFSLRLINRFLLTLHVNSDNLIGGLTFCGTFGQVEHNGRLALLFISYTAAIIADAHPAVPPCVLNNGALLMSYHGLERVYY